MKKLSCIIVSYRNIKLLSDCLDSVYKFNDINECLEVIVVDNSPTNELFDYIKKRYEQIKIIKNENKGFGHGNNLGVKHSHGTYLLFLNPDTILVEPIFHKLIKCFEKEKKVGIIGLQLLNAEGKKNTSFHFIDETSLIKCQLSKILNKYGCFFSKSMYICGADLAISKNLFNLVNGFDENMFMYYEEPDITKRVLERGYCSFFMKDAKLIHLEGGVTENTLKSEVHKIRSYKYYCKKYNYNFNKIIKKQIYYMKFKKMIFHITQQKSRYHYYLNLIEVYKNEIKD